MRIEHGLVPDYTDVSFKRWIKACGDLAMVLIVLTDVNPSAAVKACWREWGFCWYRDRFWSVILFVCGTHVWGEGGEAYTAELRPSKNELGGICLLFGWERSGSSVDTFARKEKKTGRRADPLRRVAWHGPVAVLEGPDDDCAGVFPDGELLLLIATCFPAFSRKRG